jgi:hypothetical protein
MAIRIVLPAGAVLKINDLEVEAEKAPTLAPAFAAPVKRRLARTTTVRSEGTTSTGATHFNVALFDDGSGLCGCEYFVFSLQGNGKCKHIEQAIRRY